ncbi:hypothetical protein J7I98_35805 [Streptomyces sp. ISL-98]|uniref:hypothetical protein n=1 Tax=Streptomyces sp. ISL-98 TaxID=2819192 RepID=UPI001BE8F98D|nr:hypothetical protein [Streptomyces sp. ISL-98]MBT2511096.1 hypothetical protein [Streptomyces sp. ISL-98]
MRELLDKIDTLQQLVRETTERLREQITLLTEQLVAAEDTLKRLEITRERRPKPPVRWRGPVTAESDLIYSRVDANTLM